MKVLLTYPLFPDTFWSFKHVLKFIGKKASYPPIGLLTVAALLPETWEKKVIDLNVEPLNDKDIEWADIVMIGGMTVQSKSAEQIVTRCKEKGKPIVAGGPLFTIEFERFPEVDYFVLDEAEVTLPEFIADLEKGTPKPIYRANRFPDLDTSPVPLWHLIDLDKYVSTSIQYSRGCPFQCEFCNVTALFGHKFRTKHTKQIIDELDTLYNAGQCRNVMFVDDNMIGNKARLKRDLLPALIEWRKNKDAMTFITEVSIDLADDDELMEMMVEAGFITVFIGVETPDAESLTECNKKQNENRDLIADIKKMQRAGLQVLGGFIVGFDSDKPSIFQRQVEFIQNSGIVTAMVGLLQAPPGTKLYERLKKEGRLLGNMSGDNVDGTTNIIPKMSLQALIEGYHNVLNQIYSPELYYERIRTFLSEYNGSKIKSSLKLRLRDYFTLVHILFTLGFIDKGRRHYWKTFFWTLFNKPKLMPTLITLSVYGFHFRKVTHLITSKVGNYQIS